MEKIKLSIVIPCYNEEKNIPLIIKRLSKVLNNKDMEFILVDNGSMDNSRKLIQNYSKKYPAIKLAVVEKNIGYGYGIYTGLKSAKGEFLAWTHADLQTDPNDTLKAYELIKKQKNPEKTYVKGSRYGRLFFDKFFEFGMSIFESIILAAYLYDINAQPNIFHKSFLNLMKNPPNDFSFDLYAYYLSKKNKYKVVRFPVLFPKRIHGESKWNAGDFKSKYKFIKRTLDFTFKLKKYLQDVNN